TPKGKWVVGHAIGKSPQDSYYQDDQGNLLFMLASFIPMFDFSPGATGTGRLLSTTRPVDNTDISWWLYEKDGRTAMVDDGSGSGSGDGSDGGGSDSAYA